MNITTCFRNKGALATGLSPTISIWKLDGTVIINNQAMIEIASGFYYYDFTTYDNTIDYVIVANGGATLVNSDRYVTGTNENDSLLKSINTDLAFIKKIEGGRWKIDTDTNEMIFYEDDNVTEVARFNLFDKKGIAASKDIAERVRM